jgi:rSAM/selenodomain-associated transferase 1
MSIAVGIFCKTPSPGASKTRLSPPLTPEECAALSACFIRDLAATIAEVAADGDVVPYAIYTPAGSEAALRTLLPPAFRPMLQAEGDFTARVITATRELLANHDGAILVNSDSPTLPASILRDAVRATRLGGLVLSPALDGGYTLIGVSALHERLYWGIPWSTPEVYAATLARAEEIGMPVTNVPGWYDVDDAASLALLRDELAGKPLGFTQIKGASATATRAFLA